MLFHFGAERDLKGNQEGTGGRGLTHLGRLDPNAFPSAQLEPDLKDAAKVCASVLLRERVSEKKLPPTPFMP